jgi:hypothetical protein
VIYLDEGIAGVHELTTPKFPSSRLETAGFTYDFIDPVSLADERAHEVRGKLFGAGPAYRALVLNQQARIPAEVAERILAAASGGLAVAVIGDAPASSTGLKDAAASDTAVAQAMTKLLALDSVIQVNSADDVASGLIALRVAPSASFGESSPLMSVHRKTDDGEDIYWVFNPSSEDVTAAGSFAARGTPYQLDLWNGKSARVAQWSGRDDRIFMPVTVPSRGTAVWMFQQQGTPLHVTATSADGAGYDGDALVLRDLQGGREQVTLSDGSMHTVELTPPPAALDVGDWMLVVAEISPNGPAQHTVQLPVLKDWRDIPVLLSGES